MKRAVVTGGTSGIGLATTVKFLENGYSVVAASRSESACARTVEDLKAKGYDGIYAFPCDVSKCADVSALCDFIMEKLGGIDVVVNNAGVFISGELHETSEADWDRLFDIDVKSIYLTSKYFVPYMIKNGGGAIVNTASVCGLQGDYNNAVYNAAKGAVVNLVKAMALDYGKYGIRVNNVCPSACATPMFLANPPEVVELFNKANPIKRICTPEEVANAIYFLASDEASSCNGVNLEVSGGINVHTGQPVQ